MRMRHEDAKYTRSVSVLGDIFSLPTVKHLSITGFTKVNSCSLFDSEKITPKTETLRVYVEQAINELYHAY